MSLTRNLLEPLQGLLKRGAAAVGLFALLGAAPANASEPEMIGVTVRGIGEAWEDPFIARVYRGSSFTGGVGLLLPLHKFVSLNVDAAFKRTAGTEVNAITGEPEGSAQSALELVPMSFTLQGRLALRNGGELFLALGPSLVVFTEEHSQRLDTGLVTTEGMKVGLESQIGLRMPTSFVQPSLAPGNQSAISAIEVEGWFGRRHQFGTEGFNLGAWRGGLGLVFRL